MRVLIDARTVRRGRTGVGIAAEEMVRALDALLVPPRLPGIHGDHCDNSQETGLSLAGPLAPSVDAMILPGTLSEWNTQGPLRTINLLEEGVDYQRHPAHEWDQWSGLPDRLRKGRYTHYWSTSFAIPFRRIAGCIYIATIHDLAVFSHSHCFPKKFAWLTRLQIRNTARLADWIHVPTDFVAEELRSCTGFPKARTFISPLGVSPYFSPWPLSRLPARDPALPDQCRLEGRPFVAAPGGKDPRKNVPRLLQGFARILKEYPNLPHRLVLIGNLPPGGLPSDLSDRVVALGWLSREQVRAVYRHADAFAFVSMTEGFGLPVLEAMACGCPVMTSHAGSLPTVTGKAAVLIDPLDCDSISLGLAALLMQSDSRLRLRALGLERCSEFPWTRTVRPIAEIFQPQSWD